MNLPFGSGENMFCAYEQQESQPSSAAISPDELYKFVVASSVPRCNHHHLPWQVKIKLVDQVLTNGVKSYPDELFGLAAAKAAGMTCIVTKSG
ncbi:unnamed protein product [Microthlaspi erraticum]|uniref:Uncharacterized protein n=1 Tax=Microthlaspi erraticum TaxID=1685480 RepID=A0A6D2LGC1_9BRAS|nr:unnamed protein product [Microthlaspi erraticum]CAA7060199.1 unnamed protein product [Microthlaspi erraticum]